MEYFNYQMFKKKNNRKENKSIIMGVLFLFIGLDMFAYIAWNISDQKPNDNFRLGYITELIIK